ncbi:MAG: hypothetical protein ACYS7M_13970, partial [Planctomycetota bacterium]
GDAPEAELMLVPCAVLFVTPLIGWVVHRTIGALMTSWWVACGLLDDVAWAAKVLAYETAYLWVFCVYNGVLLSSYMWFGFWITEMVSDDFFYKLVHMPAEPALVIFGNIALCVAWLWRYQLAIRTIRWNNF